MYNAALPDSKSVVINAGHKLWWVLDWIGLVTVCVIVALELVLLGLWSGFYDESYFSDSSSKSYFEDLSGVAYLNKALFTLQGFLMFFAFLQVLEGAAPVSSKKQSDCFIVVQASGAVLFSECF